MSNRLPDVGLTERLPRYLRLRELRIFLTVMEQRSFRKAATTLHVTQPAITKAIANLEDVLSVRLFDRTANGVEPTAHGTTFARHARAVFEELRHAAQELALVSSGVSGRLRIGSVPLPGGYMLPLAVNRLLQRHPAIFVTIEEMREAEILEEVRKRSLDVALVRLLLVPPSEDMRVETLFEPTLCVLAARSHRLAAQPVVTWPELVRERWVLPRADSAYAGHVRRVLARLDLDMPRACVETPSIHMQYALVMHGGMLAFGSRPPKVTSPFRDQLVRLPLNLPVAPNPIGAITLASHGPDPLVEQLLAEIRRLAEGDD